MKGYRQLFSGTLALLVAFTGQGTLAQNIQAANKTAPTTAATAAVRHSHHSTPAAAPIVSKEDLEQLRRAMAAEGSEDQRRFDALQQKNDQLEQQLAIAETRLDDAQQKLGQLTLKEDPQIAALHAAVESLKSTQMATSAFVDQQKTRLPQQDHPLAWQYKGVRIAPGGFFAAEALYRTHAENADINTTWNSIPYDSQVMSHLSEFRATSRQTRLLLRADGTAGNETLTGYFETDFLGTGYGASEVQTNGYSNRIRQLWGRVQFPGGWTFSGGQMWSLITTNRTGIENLTEFGTALVDGSQLPGNDYARQTAFRLTKSFDGNRVTSAFAAENAATVGVTPANVPASVTNILAGLSTTGTGALSNTTYSTNVAPDLIAKVAFDPGFGHYEIKAVGRTFRDRMDSTATTKGYNNTELGGAFGGAVYLPVFTKKVSYIGEAMWGEIGRYGATSTDVIVKPNGILSFEKSLHALTGFETHPSARLDWYVYASDEFLPRNYGYGLKTINNAGCFVEATAGSSTPPSCSPSTRDLESGATGFWYRFYKGPSGMVQYGANYVYIVKQTWVGAGGAPRGVENLIESSFRYYLP